MNQENKKSSLWLQLLYTFLAVNILFGLIIAILYYAELDTWLTVAVTVIVGLYLFLIIFITAQITRRQTIATLREGAAIALKAQETNDKWDAQKTTAMAGLVREGLRIGVSNAPRLPAGAPPLSVGDWLTLPEPIEGDFVESEED